MMPRFEAEPRATKPRDFDAWLLELQLFTDANGEEAAIGVLMHFAPVECLRYLVAQPALWDELLSRGRYADRVRFEWGIAVGRRQNGSVLPAEKPDVVARNRDR